MAFPFYFNREPITIGGGGVRVARARRAIEKYFGIGRA